MLYAAVVFVVVCLSLCLPELCSVTVFVFCGLNLEPESCGKPCDTSEPWLPQTLGCSSYSSPMYLYIYIYMSFVKDSTNQTVDLYIHNRCSCYLVG